MLIIVFVHLYRYVKKVHPVDGHSMRISNKTIFTTPNQNVFSIKISIWYLCFVYLVNIDFRLVTRV